MREFRERRAVGQERLMAVESLVTRRFLSLDTQCYKDATAEGGLDERTKELLGLVASAVLRCDDCIAYHVEGSVRSGWSRGQVEDALNVAMVVGGTIVIPHARRALLHLDECLAEQGRP